MNITIEMTAATKSLLAKISQTSPQIVKTAIRSGLEMGSRIFQLESKQAAPVKTGNLRRNIQYKVSDDSASIFVPDNVKYAVHQEYGTRPHTIVPRVKKVLADKQRGIIFGKIVRHPGFKGKFYMRQGSEKTAQQSQKINDSIYNELKKGLTT